MSDLFCLQSDRSKPVYNKIYQPGPEENIDYKEEFEKIQSNVEYSIDDLELVNSALLPLDIMKKIDYRLIVNKIDDMLYESPSYVE